MKKLYDELSQQLVPYGPPVDTVLGGLPASTVGRGQSLQKDFRQRNT